jgi:UDP:flavonoid glycosyltransferase YjiC (YdhE family)
MRVLITSFPQVSHMFPMVPLAWSLRNAGHEVLFVTPPGLDRVIASSGLPVTAVGKPVDMVAFFRARLPEGKMPVEAWGGYGTEVMLSMAARTWSNVARGFLDELLKVATEWRPDVVLRDPMELASRVVAGVLGIPTVEHRWGPDASSGEFEVVAAKQMRPLVRKYGLAELSVADFTIDPTPPSLLVPGGKAGIPTRFIPYNGSGSLPERRPVSGRPKVCVSFGSIAASVTEGRLVRWTLEALREIGGVDVTLALSRRDFESVGEVSEDVETLLDVPLNLLIGGHDALVYHGGDGTGFTGLCHGVPQVVLPQMANQFTFAERIEASGAGRSLADVESQTSVSAIGAAIEDVLNKPDYRAAAIEMQAEIAGMPAPPELVPQIEQYVAEARA